MNIRQHKIYYILFFACVGGYCWLLFSANQIAPSETGVCLVKHITGIPCPSCGSTRSVLSLVQGKPAEAFYWNPFGFVILTTMILVPIWIVRDIIKKQNSLFHFYQKMESLAQRKSIYLPAILLVIMNWVWNIMKSL